MGNAHLEGSVIPNLPAIGTKEEIIAAGAEDLGDQLNYINPALGIVLTWERTADGTYRIFYQDIGATTRRSDLKPKQQ